MIKRKGKGEGRGGGGGGEVMLNGKKEDRGRRGRSSRGGKKEDRGCQLGVRLEVSVRSHFP